MRDDNEPPSCGNRHDEVKKKFEPRTRGAFPVDLTTAVSDTLVPRHENLFTYGPNEVATGTRGFCSVFNAKGVENEQPLVRQLL